MTRVDLRSDTLTRPTASMRRVMATAEVGDDVYGEDPTVRRLEEHAAQRLGFEAALFVPSGTMANQIAVHLHVRPGLDVLLEADCHISLYELGAMACWSGAMARPLHGLNGMLDPAELSRRLEDEEYQIQPAALLCLEDTHNHAGGRVMPSRVREGLLSVTRTHDLRVHLDGARIFNSAIASGRPVSELAAGCDTLMFCLSKGLGAPVGSVLCGSVELMRQARIVRRRMGGGMRQAGILAAAGLYALEHHVERLEEDHRRARRLAHAVAEHKWFELDAETVETNIVTAGTRGKQRDEVLERLAGAGVLAGAMGPRRVRFVTHLDVDDAGLEHALAALIRL